MFLGISVTLGRWSREGKDVFWGFNYRAIELGMTRRNFSRKKAQNSQKGEERLTVRIQSCRKTWIAWGRIRAGNEHGVLILWLLCIFAAALLGLSLVWSP